MKTDRLARVNERVREELAAAFYRMTPGEGVETSRVSFVEVRVAPDLHNAIVLVSVLGDEAVARRSMSWLRAHRADFQRRIADKVGLKYTPVLDFRATGAIAGGDRVLAILEELESNQPGPADAGEKDKAERP